MTDQDTVRLDKRIDRLEEHLDLKFDGINAILNEHTEQIAKLDGKMTILILMIPFCTAVACTILGWILTHSKFVG